MYSRTITVLLDQLRYGGAERALVYLARGFSEEGYRVDFLIRNERFGAYLSDLPATVNLRKMPKSHPLALRWHLARHLPQIVQAAPSLAFGLRSLPIGMRSLPALARYLKECSPTALLTTLPQNNLLALWARESAKSNTRVVIREANCLSRSRELNGRGSKSALLPLAKQWYPAAHKIVAVSQGVADDLAQSLQINRARILTIHNPVDLRRIHDLAQDECPHPWFNDESQPVLVTVGRLNPQKDHRTLLRALQLVNQRHPTRLIVVGEGSLGAELKAEAESLGIARQVHWAGLTDNPYAYVARAKAFVLSSAWEGLPNVLLEAFACGTPVVSTDAAGGGPAELLQGGRLGKLVPVADPPMLAEAICATLRQPPDVSLAHRYVQEFSLSRSTRAYLSALLN